jgi:hypothetical protein
MFTAPANKILGRRKKYTPYQRQILRKGRMLGGLERSQPTMTKLPNVKTRKQEVSISPPYQRRIYKLKILKSPILKLKAQRYLNQACKKFPPKIFLKKAKMFKSMKIFLF